MLALQLLWGAVRFTLAGDTEPVVPNAESLQVADLLGTAQLAAEEREEITRRPLFWSSRTPLAASQNDASEEAGDDKAGPPGTLEGVKLAGVFGAGQDAGIIVVNKGKKQRLAVGEELNGWTLKAVDPTQAVLSNKGRRAELTLTRGVPVKARASAPGRKAAAAQAGQQGKAGKRARQGRQTDNNKQSAKTEDPESAPPVPDSLGLGGGDRNRGITDK